MTQPASNVTNAKWQISLEWALLGLAGLGLTIYTAIEFPVVTVALNAASLVMFAATLWAAQRLLGRGPAGLFAVLALLLGWFAEQMGSSRGWFFGRYTYTDVLGLQLGNVPLVIPLMWFALCFTGYVMTSFLLWRQPVPDRVGMGGALLVAWLAAMIVTAFDLGADPYFVFVLKAWIMKKTDGGWFGETLQGFAGWMLIGGLIVLVFQLTAAARRPVAAPRPCASEKLAALVPLCIYGSALLFQLAFGHPIEIRAIAFFAMGIPLLVASVGWWHWKQQTQRTDPGRLNVTKSYHLEGLVHCADPLADDTVAALIPPGTPLDTRGVTVATRLMAGWTTNASLSQWQPDGPQNDPQIVKALQSYLEQGKTMPAWVDAAKVARAEQLFFEYGPMSCTLLFCSSLPECYLPPHLAEVLHIAGQLETHTENRIRQTAAMVFPVMMHGGLLSDSGSGVAQVLKVRLIHATIRHLIVRGNPSAATGRIAPLLGASEPAGLHEAMLAHGWDVDAQGLPCNQVELAYTLLTFSYCFLQGMRKLGQRLSRADEEAYLHAWNVVGHILGIETALMAHTMEEAQSLFESIQSQSLRLQPASDPRPALGGALMNTMAKSIKLPVIRQIPVPLTRWLIGQDSAEIIGVNQRISWLTQIIFWLGLGLTRLIDTIVQLVLPRFSLTRMFTRIVGYHLITRFLLDKTRPLNLPDHLLDPVHQTVAAWDNDQKAPDWINRLEDRLTTTGPWNPVSIKQGGSGR